MLLPFERKTLNKILTKVTALPDAISTVKTAVDTLAANWTATRAGYLDNIRSYTITNNTGSLTGVLSAKLTYIANSLIGAVNNTGGTYNSGSVHAKLATLILNDPATKFVAGTGITKYNPITTSIGLGSNSTKWVYSEMQYSQQNNSSVDILYVYRYTGNAYSFTPNRDGTVRLTVTAKGYSSTSYLAVAVTDDKNEIYHKGRYVKFLSSTVETKTIDFDVTAGTKYTIVIGVSNKDSSSYRGDVTSMKVSYDVIANTSLL